MPQTMTAPPRAVPSSDSGYFEVLTQAVFQAGFSWGVIQAKWPHFQAAFDGFDIDAVAAYGPPDEDRLLADAGIVRNGRKISATIVNARTLRTIREEHGSVGSWLATSRTLAWPQRKDAVAKPFASFGPSGAYFFLWSVGEATPPHEEECDWTGVVSPDRALEGAGA